MKEISRLHPDTFDLEELRNLGPILGTGGFLDGEHLFLETVLAIVSGDAEGAGGGEGLLFAGDELVEPIQLGGQRGKTGGADVCGAFDGRKTQFPDTFDLRPSTFDLLTLLTLSPPASPQA